MIETRASIDPLDFAERAMRNGREVAVATIIDCPPIGRLRAGRQMAVDETGAIAGGFGDERIDAAVLATTRAVIASGAPETIAFAETSEPLSAEAGAGPNSVRVYVERVG